MPEQLSASFERRLRQQDLLARFAQFALAEHSAEALHEGAMSAAASGLGCGSARVEFTQDLRGEFRCSHQAHEVRAVRSRSDGCGNCRFDEQDRTFLQTIANLLACSLERKRIDDALRAANAGLHRKHLELHQQLAHADRLASLGTLAAGVAHELNNPLSWIISNLSWVAETLSKPVPDEAEMTEVREAVQDARHGAERLRSIVQDLRTFSRVNHDPAGEVDVRTVLDSAAAIAAYSIRGSARLQKRYEEVPPIQGSAARLGQVFLNLLVNAAQAIGEGSPDKNEIRISTFLEGRHVVVEIEDTGCGIAPEDLGRVFDPFFTTKPSEIGTGLGLAICRSIVTGLGGEITIASAPGQGTCVRVGLPAERTEASTAPPLRVVR